MDRKPDSKPQDGLIVYPIRAGLGFWPGIHSTTSSNQEFTTSVIKWNYVLSIAVQRGMETVLLIFDAFPFYISAILLM